MSGKAGEEIANDIDYGIGILMMVILIKTLMIILGMTHGPPKTKVKVPIINDNIDNIDMRRNLVNMYSHWTLAFFVQPRDRP